MPTVVEDVGDITAADYEFVRQLVYKQSGINLGKEKMQLVRARLGKKVRQGGFPSFQAYLRHVEADASGDELCSLLDAISTNTTHLFREIRHFELLRTVLLDKINNDQWARSKPTVRIWSAACSSGEEPHSIAMVVAEVLRRCPGADFKILATDLSTQMLGRARRCLYEAHRVGTVPAELKSRYMRNVTEGDKTFLQLVPDLLKRITFTRFNLMSPSFPFRHGFDVVFCRNVMIYFDRKTQETLVKKIAQHLHPGGYLLIGHSESLNAVQHPLEYLEPTVYRKRE